MSTTAMDNSTLPGLEAATASGDAVNPLGSSNGSLSETSAWGISGSGPWLLACMLSLIILMTACGNTLLIALVFAQRSLRNTSNCFLVSLFLSDLMVALVVMPPAMLNVLYGAWVLWPGFCPVWLCFDVMCCSASILNLCVISLDRYLLIISPLRYKQRMTPPRALLLVGGAWGLAALTSFLPIKMNWHSLGHGSGHSPMHGAGSANVSTYPELSLWYHASYFQLSQSGGLSFQCCLRVTFPFALVASVLTFFLPSSAICFTYCQILLAARRQARRVAALSQPPYPHHSPEEPSHPPSPGGGAAGHAHLEGDDYSHQENPVSRHVPVRAWGGRGNEGGYNEATSQCSIIRPCMISVCLDRFPPWCLLCLSCPLRLVVMKENKCGDLAKIIRTQPLTWEMDSRI